MNRLVVSVIFIFLPLSCIYAQTTGAAQTTKPVAGAPTAAQASAGNPDNVLRGTFPTILVKPLDSKKLKEGDVVACQTTGALHTKTGLLIPSGSKVIGHITQAQARSKGDSASTLAFAFDKIEVMKGKELPMKGILQAVGPSLGGNSGPDTGPGGGLGMGGHGGNATDTATVAAPSNAGVAGPNSGVHPLNPTGSRPILISDSQGVLGLKDLEMSKDSVLSSPGKEVKLDSGSQILIRAEITLPTQ